MLKCPCTQYCTRRYGGCVSDCEEYAEYEASRAEKRNTREKRRATERLYEEYIADTLIRGERYKRNKKRT